jgi:Ca2+:H+ antiporter
MNYRYVASRIFLYDPPGDDNAFSVHPDAPEELKKAEWDFAHQDPETSPWVCIILLAITVAVMAYTAEIVSCAQWTDSLLYIS